MTLDAALQGLKDYWKVRPNGGTRAELLALATSRGFVEPLLAVWLNVLIKGFFDRGIIAANTYTSLASFVASATPLKAGLCADTLFVYLDRPSLDLNSVRKSDLILVLDTEIAELTAELATLEAALTRMATAMVSDPDLGRLLDATQPARDALTKQITSRRVKRDTLAIEIA